MSYCRENIDRMEAYRPGFQPKGEGWIKLNTNENPFPPSPKVLEALQQVIDGRVRLYPDPLAEKLREKIGELYGVEKECVIVGNGCDDVLSMAARAFLGERDALLMTRPTYTLYRVLGHIQGANVMEVALGHDFALPEDFFSQRAELTLISNPNPPTGILYEKAALERLCEESSGVVVIDEAYADFAEWNCLELAGQYENVVIARSLSKSMALAGLRVGFAIAGKELIQGMMKVKDSYNVNCLSQVAAMAALEDMEYTLENVRRICEERSWLAGRLRGLGWRVFPSQANFVFAVPMGITVSEVYEALFRQKILVRYFDAPETRDGLRITIGSPEENHRLLEAIRAIAGETQK